MKDVGRIKKLFVVVRFIFFFCYPRPGAFSSFEMASRAKKGLASDPHLPTPPRTQLKLYNVISTLTVFFFSINFKCKQYKIPTQI